MKQVFPQVRPRRLGTRGNSRYCYAGLKKRLKLEEPDTIESTDDKNNIKVKKLNVIILVILLKFSKIFLVEL